jgi:hypothetical protein
MVNKHTMMISSILKMSTPTISPKSCGCFVEFVDRTSNKAAIRRLTSSIQNVIVSAKSKSWNTLVENMNVASCIYVFLYLLSNTVDPLRHDSGGIFIESLQDLLDERYRFSDDWEVVGVTQRVRNALLLPIPACAPVLVL